MKYINDINIFLDNFLKSDKKNLILGEDINDPYGGAFKVTKGLSSKYKGQVISTPISEAAITGLAIGLMLQGHKVILEIMFGDFITLCADQIINGASKFQSLSKNKKLGNLMIRCPMGGYRGYGPTHSQSLETMFLNIPNINIFSPNVFSSPCEIYKNAINNHNISILIEHKISYSKEVNSRTPDLYNTKIINNKKYDKISILEKKSDYTILTYGYVAEIALNLIKEIFIEKELIGEIICLKQLKPIDLLILNEVSTNKIITLEEGIVDYGWGRIISSYIYDIKKNLDILNLGAKNDIIPASINEELNHLPTKNNLKPKILEFLISKTY
jgi:pyruvate/2-oxoglutarate/acetoin dehydrogenase E1 component